MMKTDYLEDLGADRKIVLKLIFKVDLEFGIDLSGSCETSDYVQCCFFSRLYEQ
jgi:hypothetical protein